jgi:hypothetical protein
VRSRDIHSSILDERDTSSSVEDMENFDFSREIWGGGNDGLMESEEN